SRDEGDAEGSETPLVSIGASFLYNLLPTDAAQVGLSPDVDGNGKLDNVALWEAGGELAARWRGASLQGELFHRRLHYGAAAPPAVGNDRLTTGGGYVQAGYFVLPHRVELAARYSYAQPIAFGLDSALRPAVPAVRHEVTWGVSYLIVGRTIRAQAEYSYLE